MPGFQFSVPFNDDARTLMATIEMTRRNGNSIREVYLNAPSDIAGSGRVGSPMSEEKLRKLAEIIHTGGMRVDLAMNATCEGPGWYSDAHVGRVVDFVRRMHEDAGIEAVTIANPFYIEAVRTACPAIEISVSVLSAVDSFEKARAYADAGANTITPDTSINRNLSMLKGIHEHLGLEIKLMVNEGCLNRCPYRLFHMNHISHRAIEDCDEGREFSFACGALIEKDPAMLFRSNWVRPEDLRRYEGITTYFKIVGRDMLRSRVVRSIKAYMDESYDGNLLDIICSSIGFYGVEKGACIDNKALDDTGFFERLSACDRECWKCSYCSTLAESLVSYGPTTEENLLDLGQYRLAAALRMAKATRGEAGRSAHAVVEGS